MRLLGAFHTGPQAGLVFTLFFFPSGGHTFGALEQGGAPFLPRFRFSLVMMYVSAVASLSEAVVTRVQEGYVMCKFLSLAWTPPPPLALFWFVMLASS